MYYTISVATSEHSTFTAIVKNPRPQNNGILRADKIAKFNGFSEEGKPEYIRCDPVELIVGGTFVLEEYTGEILG